MAAEPVLVPEAEEDVANAYEWYEKRRHGLGEEFLSCIDAARSRRLRLWRPSFERVVRYQGQPVSEA